MAFLTLFKSSIPLYSFNYSIASFVIIAIFRNTIELLALVPYKFCAQFCCIVITNITGLPKIIVWIQADERSCANELHEGRYRFLLNLGTKSSDNYFHQKMIITSFQEPTIMMMIIIVIMSKTRMIIRKMDTWLTPLFASTRLKRCINLICNLILYIFYANSQNS